MESEWHKRVRTNIAEYLKKEDFDVRTSHEKAGKLPLYIEKVLRSTFTSDVDIIAIKEGQVRLIVEVQNSIRPKDIIGIIGVINISTIYADREKKITYPLKDITLIIVSKSLNNGSKKKEQVKLIQDRLNLGDGCLKQFLFCSETDFKSNSYATH